MTLSCCGMAAEQNRRNFREWNSHGYMTMAIPGAEISPFGFSLCVVGLWPNNTSHTATVSEAVTIGSARLGTRCHMVQLLTHTHSLSTTIHIVTER